VRRRAADNLTHTGLVPLLLVQIVGLMACPTPGKAQPAGLGGTVHPPCLKPPAVDTTGWRVERLITMDGWHFFFRLPPSFNEDDQKFRFYHGGRTYVDGVRTIINGGGDLCVPGPEAPGCAECVDTIAGYPFVLTSSYRDGLYHVGVSRIRNGLVTNRGLHLMSADSSDQGLFFAIVRSFEERLRISRNGTLFVGGHEMKAPFVFTCPEGRLTVNGYWMPDLVPATSRRPNANAELEARRTIAARLVALRDSLLGLGIDWPETQERLRAVALREPFVKSVRLESRPRPDSSFTPGFMISWAFGYNTTVLTRKSRPLTMGGRERTFEEDWHFWTARLDYLKSLLDKGSAVFLLGGGCEFVVAPARAAPVVDAARRIARGSPVKAGLSQSVPEDVKAELRSSLPLEHAQ